MSNYYDIKIAFQGQAFVSNIMCHKNGAVHKRKELGGTIFKIRRICDIAVGNAGKLSNPVAACYTFT